MTGIAPYADVPLVTCRTTAVQARRSQAADSAAQYAPVPASSSCRSSTSTRPAVVARPKAVIATLPAASVARAAAAASAATAARDAVRRWNVSSRAAGVSTASHSKTVSASTRRTSGMPATGNGALRSWAARPPPNQVPRSAAIASQAAAAVTGRPASGATRRRHQPAPAARASSAGGRSRSAVAGGIAGLAY